MIDCNKNVALYRKAANATLFCIEMLKPMRFRSAKTHLENERVARRENIRASVCAARMLSLRQNKRSSFPGHAPGKDTLRAANAATERGLTGENVSVSVSEQANVVTRQKNKRSVFSRTCAGKRHLKSRARGDENEVYGEKTTDRASCEVRLLSSRPSSKEGFTGRKQNKRSEFCCLPVIS